MPYGNWIEITPSAPIPPARRHAGLAYDRLSSKTLLFGGYDGVTPRLSDTWHFTPGTTSWQQKFPAASPTARYGHGCCDTRVGVHIFGGNDGVLKDDLWAYDTTSWWQRLATGPVAREFAALATSPLRVGFIGDCLLWGGDTGGAFDDLIWIYSSDDAEWYSFESYAKPTPRKSHSMYYDSDRNVVVMFGGVSIDDNVPLNDLWETDGKQWMPLTTLSRPRARRSWQGMAFDPRYHRAALAPTGIGASGTITTYLGRFHRAGDFFTLDDGLNPVKTFEVVPVLVPTDVILIGAAPATSLRFDLTSLFSTAADPTASINHAGTSIYLKCALTGNIQTATATYSGGVNYADSTDLMGQGDPPSNQPDEYRVGMAPTVGNIVIEAERSATKNQMRDVIAAAINAAAPLDITAYSTLDGIVNLFNDRADPNGNTASATSVSVAGFSVSDMTGAVTESWTYNRSGGLWLYHPEAQEAPVLDGASLAFDSFANVFVLYGGEKEGTLQNKQYEWQWSNVGISPLYSLPGGFQGRLKPVMSKSTDGQWLYVLGADMKTLPDFMLDIGDSVKVKQQITLAGQKLLRFDWRMRYSSATPRYEVLVDLVSAPGSLDFRTSGLLLPSTSADGVYGIRLRQPLFKRGHANQLCRVSGALDAPNNGTFRITDVPSSIGEVGAWGAGGPIGALQAGMVAVIENSAMVHRLVDPGVKLDILGAQWRAQLYINDGVDDVLVTELVEHRVQADPDGWQRGALAAHISKLSAVTTLTFILKLESTDQP
jgi:hypothetical protein